MVHIDPLIHVVPPRDRPDLADEADHETFDDTFFAWDVIAGRRHPELGGSPEILDIVGVNCYSFGQMEYREQGPHASLEPHDERIRPLCDLLDLRLGALPPPDDRRRDERPGRRAAGLAARHDRGIARRGPTGHRPARRLPVPGRGHARLAHGRMAAQRPVRSRGGERTLRRMPFQPYIDELRRWQRSSTA